MPCELPVVAEVVADFTSEQDVGFMLGGTELQAAELEASRARQTAWIERFEQEDPKNIGP